MGCPEEPGRAALLGFYLENKGVIFCGINRDLRAFEIWPSNNSLKRDKDFLAKG